jgi:hypothetical protein
VEKRLYTRFKVDVPVSFSGHSAGDGTIYNLGVGGCKMLARARMVEGAMLTLRLRLPEQFSTVTIRAATVRWVMGQECGLEFLVMQEPDRERLAKFLHTVR